MNLLTARLANSPVAARVAPFITFLALTFCQDYFGDAGRYWFYLAKTLIGAWMLWMVRGIVQEMRWKLSWEAVLAGIAVFVLWVGLDQIVPTERELWGKVGAAGANPGSPPPSLAAAWNPLAQFGHGTGWFFCAVRVLGMTLVVPPLEEVFYRSFLYRWIARPDFAAVPLGQFAWKPFLIAVLIFGLAHNEWLPGILCAAFYQGLVCWRKRLGDAMTAHAVTNFLLGVWVVWRGAWHFW